jgi:hypothetical protein
MLRPEIVGGPYIFSVRSNSFGDQLIDLQETPSLA